MGMDINRWIDLSAPQLCWFIENIEHRPSLVTHPYNHKTIASIPSGKLCFPNLSNSILQIDCFPSINHERREMARDITIDEIMTQGRCGD